MHIDWAKVLRELRRDYKPLAQIALDVGLNGKRLQEWARNGNQSMKYEHGKALLKLHETYCIGENMVTKHDLMAAMVHCTGRHKGISAKRLAQKMGDIPERRVRQLVTECREDGIAICGLPETGYYIAQTQEEVEETVEFLKDRALKSLQLASILSKRPLADLAGQLHLRT